LNVGLYTPNDGQMGTVGYTGTGPAQPYGQADPTSAAPVLSTGTMQGPGMSAVDGTAYKPVAGRADRLSANIVGSSTFDNAASGGYSAGATHRI
jgi:hypothetical protein